jgi:hypothetical protein
VVVWTTLLLKHVSVETWDLLNYDSNCCQFWYYSVYLMSNSIDGWIMGMFFFIDFLLWNVIYSWQVYNLWKPMEVNHCMDSNIGTNSKWTSHLGLLTHPRWTNTHNCTKSLFWIRHFKGHIKPRKHYYCKVSINNHECTQWMICFELLCCDWHKEMRLFLYFISNHAMVN